MESLREELIAKICNALKHHSERKRESCSATVNRIAQEYAKKLGIVISRIDLTAAPLRIVGETKTLIDSIVCYHDRTNSAPVAGTIVLAKVGQTHLCIEGNNRINALRRGQSRSKLEFVVMDVG